VGGEEEVKLYSIRGQGTETIWIKKEKMNGEEGLQGTFIGGRGNLNGSQRGADLRGNRIKLPGGKVK